MDFCFRKRNCRDVTGKREKHESCESAIRESLLLLEKRFSTVDVFVPAPAEVLRCGEPIKYSKTPGVFPFLDASALNKEPVKR